MYGYARKYRHRLQIEIRDKPFRPTRHGLHFYDRQYCHWRSCVVKDRIWFMFDEIRVLIYIAPFSFLGLTHKYIYWECLLFFSRHVHKTRFQASGYFWPIYFLFSKIQMYTTPHGISIQHSYNSSYLRFDLHTERFYKYYACLIMTYITPHMILIHFECFSSKIKIHRVKPIHYIFFRISWIFRNIHAHKGVREVNSSHSRVARPASGQFAPGQFNPSQFAAD